MSARIFIPEVWRGLDGGNYVPLAAFLLGFQNRKHMGTWRDRFCHEMDFGDSCVLVDHVESADLILFPHWWSPACNKQQAWQNKQVDLLSQHHERPVICHGATADILDPRQVHLPFVNGYYLSNMLISTRRSKNTLGSSYFIPDCRQRYSFSASPLAKPPRPSVGFCGIAAPFKTTFNKTKLLDYLRLGLTYMIRLGVDPEELARCFGNNTKHAYRARLIKQFKNHPDIDAHFVLRPHGGFLDNSYTNKGDEDPFNLEFYRNLEENLYTICCRGTENYSVRFYETLCMGRIPIVVDTDMVLPFDDVIDYRRHCVWIEQKHIHRASEILLEFHQRHSEAELSAVQDSNRALWETHLSHVGFYNQLVRYLR